MKASSTVNHPHLPRRTFLLGLLLVLCSALPAAAQGRLIEGFAISPTDQAKDAITDESLAKFPASTKAVYALVTYKGARNQEVAVVVTAPGNIRVYEQMFKLQGDGTKAYAISGQAMYQTLVEDLAELADGARENAEKVGNQARGQKDYAGLVSGAAAGMVSAARLLQTWRLVDRAKAAAEDLQSKADALQKLATQTMGLSASDSARFKELSEDMLAEVEAIDDAVDALSAAEDEAADLTIAPTEADLGTGYAVKVEVGGSPADSLEFWVTDKALPTPTASEPPPPTRRPEDQATPDGTPKVTQPAPGSTGARPTGQVGTTPRATGATAVIIAVETLVVSDPGKATAVQATLDAPSSPGAGIAALPTWTPVGGGSGSGDDAPSGGSTSGGSSNIAIFGLGILALVGLVWWLRQRM